MRRDLPVARRMVRPRERLDQLSRVGRSKKCCQRVVRSSGEAMSKDIIYNSVLHDQVNFSLLFWYRWCPLQPGMVARRPIWATGTRPTPKPIVKISIPVAFAAAELGLDAAQLYWVAVTGLGCAVRLEDACPSSCPGD